MLAIPYKYLFNGISKSSLSPYSTLFDRAIIKKNTKIKIIALKLVKSNFFISFNKIMIDEKNSNKPPRPI